MREYKINRQMLYLGKDSNTLKHGTIVTIAGVAESKHTCFPYQVVFPKDGGLLMRRVSGRDIVPIPDLVDMVEL